MKEFELPNKFSDYEWLKDTYWYCPTDYMPAIQCQSNMNEFQWVADQTVWHITGYRYGYFWGVVAAVITPPPGNPNITESKLSVYGSISPNKSVHMTFLTQSEDSSLSMKTIGTGKITTYPERSFEMQMSTGPANILVVHWAFMLQTEPDQVIPGTNGKTAKEMVEGIPSPKPIK